jgi:hypothetical protein
MAIAKNNAATTRAAIAIASGCRKGLPPGAPLMPVSSFSLKITMMFSWLFKKRAAHPCAPAPDLIRHENLSNLQLILEHFSMDIVLKLGQLDGLGTND